MTDSSRATPGCLAWLSSLFQTSSKPEPPLQPAPAASPTPLPFRLRADFLSVAELSFYHVLGQVVGPTAIVCVKVSLGDLFYPKSGDWATNQALRNKINRKHVDFLLCQPGTMRPLLGLELDDASHQTADRQARDELVDQVFAAAGLPLLRQPVRPGYTTRELAALLQPYLELHPSQAALPADPGTALAHLSASLARQLGQTPPTPTTTDGRPLCPTCLAPMVLRTVRKPGPYHGRQFWGCPDYPRCQGKRAVKGEK